MGLTNNFRASRLAQWLGLDEAAAKRVREAISSIGSDEYDRYGARMRKADQVDRALEAANREMRAHGVEAIHGEYVDRYYFDIQALYVNTGDTYSATLLYDTVKERFELTTWGDWVERHRKRLNDRDY